MRITSSYFALAYLVFLPAATAHAQTIQTIAGGGPRNLQGIQTGLAQPQGLAVDSLGNVYIALSQINQIWQVNSTYQVSRFAGNGAYAFDTDGIAAINAALYQPQGMAFDTAGNLYVADTAHNRVRRISTVGIISTAAGNGTPGFSGDGGAATAAQLDHPVAVALDSANTLYIADQNNHRVRAVTEAGTITTFAGTGTAAFSGDGASASAASLNQPNGIAADSAGSVYIADSGNYRVRKVAAGVISTFAGNGVSGYSGDGGAAVNAQFSSLTGIAADRAGNVFIAEPNAVREVATGQPNIVTFAGNGSPGYSGDGAVPTLAAFNNIQAIALDRAGTSMFLADSGNGRVRKISGNTVTTFAGNGTAAYSGSGVPAANLSLLIPNALAADSAGSLYFSDAGSSSIRKLALTAGTITTTGGNGAPGDSGDGTPVNGALRNPAGLTLDPSGVVYFVEGNRVRKIGGGVFSTVINASGAAGFAGDGGPASVALLRNPSGLAIAANGDLYVADSLNHRVRKMSAATGIITTAAGTGVPGSSGDGGPPTAATLNYPVSLALDGLGNLYVAELLGNRVRKIALALSTISTVAGNGTTAFADGVPAASTGLSAPLSIAADESGNVFIADQGHARVRKAAAGTNLIMTVAGNGTNAYSGDGGAATGASLNPLALALDRSQTLYISDASGRIRSTTVPACFFTIGTAAQTFSSAGGQGTIPVTATNAACPYAAVSDSAFVTIASAASRAGTGSVTFTIAANSGPSRTAVLTVAGRTVSIAQAARPAGSPAPAVTEAQVGVFRNGFYWVLNNDRTRPFSTPPGFAFAYGGLPGDIPITGDWTGDGKTKIGIYRSINGTFILDTNGNNQMDAADAVFNFGAGTVAGDLPLVGDWNGDGRSKVGLFRQGFLWILDTNGNRVFEQGVDDTFAFGGVPGDVPVVGDWNGDGKSKPGLFRLGFYWMLDYDGDHRFDPATGDKAFPFGGIPGDVPVVGDWNGDGRSKAGIFRDGFLWILDWNGNTLFDGSGPGQDLVFPFGGVPGEKPVTGKW